MSTPLIIKLGGVILDTESALNHLCQALADLVNQQSRPLIIVHGGGCLVDKLMQQLHLPVVKKEGLRVTPANQINVITGALAGTANKLVLACAKKYQLKTIGLFLGDGQMVRVKNLDPELGHVGHASAGDDTLLHLLLNTGYLPVVSSIGMTDAGQLMNVNADQAAITLASMLDASLVLLSDVQGVLDSQGKQLPQLTVTQAHEMIAQGVITDGMVVKVKAALEAASTLQRPVTIASWRDANKLSELLHGGRFGTQVIA